MSGSDASRPFNRRSGQSHSQTQFDFNRAAKLGMLDRIVIPAEALETHREQIGSVRGLLLKVKALLRSIESFAGNDSECWASVEQIGKRMGCSERTTQRYLIVVKLLGLVTVIAGRHHTTSIHDINWSRVWEWSQPTAEANEGRQQRDERRQERQSGVTTTSVRGDNAVTQIAMTRPEAQIQTPLNRDGFLKSAGTEGRDKPPEGGVSNCGGWPKLITVAVLSDRKQVDELFEFAVDPERGWVRRDDRSYFFTLAKYCVRQARSGEIDNVGAVFTDNVKNKRWYGSNADEQAAISAAPRTAASAGGDLLPAATPRDRQSELEKLARLKKSLAASASPTPNATPPPATSAGTRTANSLP